MAGGNEYELSQVARDLSEDKETRAEHHDALRAANTGGGRMKRVPVPTTKANAPSRRPVPLSCESVTPDAQSGHMDEGKGYTQRDGVPKVSPEDHSGEALDGRHSEVKAKMAAVVRAVQVPGWEHVPAARPKQMQKAVTGQHVNLGSEVAMPRAQDVNSEPLAEVGAHKNQHDDKKPSLFDRLLPPHKTYFGLHRRKFIFVLVFIMFAFTILVAGLAAGLGKTHAAPAPKLGSGATTGWITYNPYNGALGACGDPGYDSEYIVAIGHAFFDGDANPNLDPNCGRMIRAQYNGKSVDVKVIDSCGACSKNDLDLALAPWNVLTNNAVGTKIDGVTWDFIS